MALSSALFETDWLRALRLTERRAAIQRSGGRRSNGAAEREVAVRDRIERWRSDLSIEADDDYARWLDENDWSENLLADVLCLGADAGASRLDADLRVGRPGWLGILEDAFGEGRGSTDAESPLASVRMSAEGRVFLTFVEPLVRHAIELLQHALSGLTSELPIDRANAHTLFLPSLASQMQTRIGRTLTLELHVARLREQLSGDTTEERFQSFASLLRDPVHATALLREYPVLARQLAECVMQWLDYTIEFLAHLGRDWPELRRHFADGGDPGRLVGVVAGAGDAHRGGRSVQVVHFESGLRVVYKPRALEVDEHFHDLVGWLNARGFEPVLHTPRILRGRGYGWSEFVEHAACNSDDELRRFYVRQGGLLALLYAIEATDFHMENLIAAGEHPVLVDLEALFHHRLPPPLAHSGARAMAYIRMQHSVLRVGLLPDAGGGDASKARLEMSGLGGEDGQMTPFPVLQLDGEGTDRMRVVRRHLKIGGGRNRPHVNGAFGNAYEHREAIVEGFARAHGIIRRFRNELTDRGGLLDRFAGDEVRIVLRSTRVYGRVRMEASHPSLLGDAADHECLLYRLGRAAVHKPYLRKVLRDEIADLQEGSVPAFASRPGSRDLWTSRGNRIPDFFECTSLSNVRQRIQRLDEADLARQTWFIRASLVTLSAASHHGASGDADAIRARTPIADGARSARRGGRGDLLATASAIGRRLDEMAFREDDMVSWVGVELVGEGRWTLRPIGPDLYSGTAGIALFLGYLGRVTRQPEYYGLALSLAEQASRDLEHDGADAGFARIGAFSGWSGWIYTLAHLAHLSGDASLLDTAHRIRARAAERIDDDDELDIIAGSAGLLAALGALAACDAAPEVLRDIRRCADRLVACATPALAGVAWTTTMPSSAPLTGFSHGASGMAWALLRATELTGDRRYVETALAAMAYERAVFLPDIGNWPDFREPGGDAPAAMWCHGAPGIAMTRLRALTHVDDALVCADLERALETTAARGFGSNHCICHGELGNALLLHDAARALGRIDLENRATAKAAGVARAIADRGPVCGTPAGIEVPGLMCGISGMGLALLRLAHPERVPSVLTLDPPPAVSRRVLAPAPEGSAIATILPDSVNRRKEVVARS